ncbi:translation initiation factor IF-2 [Metallumcola ferriviriculae]|uniref:Translation initiation factor IF-2 n=1 Tax=Metallumcola ferriviriculae TaxID=3039180 RepID=A0AAU0UPZ9_9FIRM|nr:translation initiation factor IF-2 [Desulfitibacteraceae bacterium MK1]
MTKKRVYEFAKELKLGSKQLMKLLNDLDIDYKSHMSSLSDEAVNKVKDHLKKLEQPQDKQKEANSNKVKSDEEKKKKLQKKNKSKDQRKGKTKGTQQNNAGPRSRKNEIVKAKVEEIEIGESISVQEYAKLLGIEATDVIKKLIGLGVMATLNNEIDAETAQILGAEYGVETKIKEPEKPEELEDIEDKPEELIERPPVVTVMGHVDHGKTSLLDAIREENVTATEAGGITQHIGAYQAQINGRKITFLDTPGHEAFTAMRARGAQATDIAILVVAADDGVMPQTVEAINHAKAAGVPVIVAINKIDKPDSNPDRVKQELTEHGLVSEDWGGETICVPVSAIRKEGLDTLLEMVLLVAEMQEIKANPDRPARGIVIEAELDKGRGPVATMLVLKGTLKVGQPLVAGSIFGKVRAMMDYKGRRIKSAGPSVPVEVLGLSDVPNAGDVFQVMDEKKARAVAGEIQTVKREEELRRSGKISLDELFNSMQAGEIKELNIVIKGDVQGSVEALGQSLERLSTDEVKVNIIHSGVGGISETDVMLATASNGIIIGFNVRPDNNARKAAEKEEIDIHVYRVIYEALDDVKAAMTGLLDPEFKEVVLGQAKVRATFKVPKAGTIAGCYVTDGKVTNSAKVRVIRNGVVVHEGAIDSLRRFKDDAKEVMQGYECGVGLENYNDIKDEDILEFYTFVEVQREL